MADTHKKILGNVQLDDGFGTEITSTAVGAKQALDVNVTGGEIIIENPTIVVDIDAFGTPPDSVLVVGSEDGTITGTKHVLKTLSDGSLVVAQSGGATELTYAEALSVASGVTTTVSTFTAGAATNLMAVTASGTNIAMYSVKINGTTIAKKYTNFGGPTAVDFDFKGGEELVATDVVIVDVLHLRPYSGDFNATIITQG